MSALPQYGSHLHPHEKMRAVVIDRYGGPEVLRPTTVPRPVPTRGQVLVRTRFIGVNPKDVIVRKGKFKVATGNKFPLLVGHDIAGEVVEVLEVDHGMGLRWAPPRCVRHDGGGIGISPGRR